MPFTFPADYMPMYVASLAVNLNIVDVKVCCSSRMVLIVCAYMPYTLIFRIPSPDFAIWMFDFYWFAISIADFATVLELNVCLKSCYLIARFFNTKSSFNFYMTFFSCARILSLYFDFAIRSSLPYFAKTRIFNYRDLVLFQINF